MANLGVFYFENVRRTPSPSFPFLHSPLGGRKVVLEWRGREKKNTVRRTNDEEALRVFVQFLLRLKHFLGLTPSSLKRWGRGFGWRVRGGTWLAFVRGEKVVGSWAENGELSWVRVSGVRRLSFGERWSPALLSANGLIASTANSAQLLR